MRWYNRRGEPIVCLSIFQSSLISILERIVNESCADETSILLGGWERERERRGKMECVVEKAHTANTFFPLISQSIHWVPLLGHSQQCRGGKSTGDICTDNMRAKSPWALFFFCYLKVKVHSQPPLLPKGEMLTLRKVNKLAPNNWEEWIRRQRRTPAEYGLHRVSGWVELSLAVAFGEAMEVGVRVRVRGGGGGTCHLYACN